MIPFSATYMLAKGTKIVDFFFMQLTPSSGRKLWIIGILLFHI